MFVEKAIRGAKVAGRGGEGGRRGLRGFGRVKRWMNKEVANEGTGFSEENL